MAIIKEREKGNLIVISGPSGAGKDSIINGILKSNNLDCWLSISMTSRDPRGQEENGKDYFFVSREEFEKHIENDNLLEYAEYNSNYYGTPKSEINKHLEKGEDVILEIEIQGALQIKELLPEALFIFIMPPSMEELKRRLENRKTDSPDKILSRFKTAYKEINEVTKYNYVVVNDDLEDAIEKTKAILIAERCRVDRIEDMYLNSKEEVLHETLVDFNN